MENTAGRGARDVPAQSDPLEDTSDELLDDGYLGADGNSRVRRTVPQRAASSMSRAQWESATASMRAISVGGDELARSDEEDVAAALASLDMPPADSPSLPISPMTDSLSGYLDRGQRMVPPEEARTSLLDRGARPTPEPRTAYLDRGQAHPQAKTTMLEREPGGAPAGSTMVAPPTLRREPPLSRPPVASRPYADDAYVASPRDSYFEHDHPRVSAGASVGAGLLHFVAIVLRLAAIALVGLIIVTAIPIGLGSYRIHIVNLMARIDAIMPAVLSGRLCFETVFGGTFRGDFALMSLILFVVDWLTSRGAYRLRGMR